MAVTIPCAVPLNTRYDTSELLRHLKAERAPKKDIALAKKVFAKKAVTDWVRTRARTSYKAPALVRRRSALVQRTGVEQRLGINFARSPGQYPPSTHPPTPTPLLPNMWRSFIVKLRVCVLEGPRAWSALENVGAAAVKTCTDHHLYGFTSNQACW